MISEIKADLQRLAKIHQAQGLRQLVAMCVFNHGIHALITYRLGKALVQNKFSPLYWPLLPLGWIVYFILRLYVVAAYDIRIALSAQIGRGFFIGHFADIKIENCKIGDFCSISQFAHIGKGEHTAGPVIGNRVWIGALSSIEGPYNIGDNATVSAGAVVKRDIKENALCLGNPARVVISEYDNSVILGLPAQPKLGSAAE